MAAVDQLTPVAHVRWMRRTHEADSSKAHEPESTGQARLFSQGEMTSVVGSWGRAGTLHHSLGSPGQSNNAGLLVQRIRKGSPWTWKVKTLPSNARILGSNPDWKLKCHMPHGQKLKIRSNVYNKSNKDFKKAGGSCVLSPMVSVPIWCFPFAV